MQGTHSIVAKGNKDGGPTAEKAVVLLALHVAHESHTQTHGLETRSSESACIH